MEKELNISDTLIESRIYQLRGYKVMLDADLAEMYGVETRALKQAVRRNKIRFPEDFMFELTSEEWEALRSQIVISKKEGKGGSRYLPYAFTEHGVMQLATVLNTEQAVMVNIQIVRVYARMKELLIMHKDILLKLEQLEGKTDKHDKEIQLIFSYIKKLIEQPKERTERIGFKKEW